MTASMTTSSRNHTSCRLYGAAKRAIRRTVPGGSRFSVTDESRRNECMTCQPAGPPIDMSPPSASTLVGCHLFRGRQTRLLQAVVAQHLERRALALGRAAFHVALVVDRAVLAGEVDIALAHGFVARVEVAVARGP